MRKLFLVLIIALFSTLSSYSQVEVDIDSVDREFHFCMIIPVRDSGYVTLQCADGKGTTIYMKIREDVFVGKLNIIITPDEKPITTEKTMNWFILPEENESK